MEGDHVFPEGSQEEGERITFKYISDTYTYYAIKEQLKKTPEEEEQKRKELEIIQEEIRRQIMDLQEDKLIIEFIQAVWREEKEKETGRKGEKEKGTSQEEQLEGVDISVSKFPFSDLLGFFRQENYHLPSPPVPDIEVTPISNFS